MLRKVLTFATVLLTLLAAATASAEPPAVPDGAYGEGAVDGDDPRVESRLFVDAEQVAPGDELRVGVLFSMDPEWHIYWRNSGDAGMSTDVEWRGDGIEYEPLTWPAPHAFEQKGEVYTFGYGDEVLVFSTARVGDEVDRGEVTVEATVDYLACKVDCIPGSSELSRTVEVGGETRGASEELGALFEQYAERVPVEPSEAGVRGEVVYSQEPIRPGDTVRAAIGLDFCPGGPDSCENYEVAGHVDAYRFIPDATSQVSWETTGVYEHPTAKAGRALELKGSASPNAPEDDERFSGVVWLKPEEGDAFAVLIQAPLSRGESGADVEQLEPTLLAMRDESAAADDSGPRGDPSAASAEAASDSTSDEHERRGGMGFWQALLFAFLGGMILNLMPCVFPVLALKVTSFAELVHEDRSHKLFHGLAYTAGIVVSMLLLAGAVLGLRAAGTQVGWGFQFQNPVFPAVLAVVVVVFALNLFGVFEIQVESTELADATKKASGLRRSAAEGVLAVVLATPCSAPFLGTAVGFALTAHPLTIVGVFASIGFGLAAPFVVFVLVPGWSNVLPRPGTWMVYVKKVLGFTLIGAAIWLAWIVGRTTGVEGMLQLLILLGVAAFATWVYGATQNAEGAGPTLAVAFAAVALLGTGWWALQFPDRAEAASPPSTAESAENADGIRWEPWSDERVAEELAKGRPVFVDFTADWCITCKANERTVLSTETVVGAMAERNVATLKADWTDGDERITKKLQAFGKGGVPMYLVYSPDRPDDPQVLPEVLSPGTVVDALERASTKAEN